MFSFLFAFFITLEFTLAQQTHLLLHLTVFSVCNELYKLPDSLCLRASAVYEGVRGVVPDCLLLFVCFGDAYFV